MGKTESNQMRIYRLLLESIRKGTYPQGTVLPSLRELSQEYYSSPGTVRQALQKLQSEGVVKARHGVGYYVEDLSVLTKHILIVEQTRQLHLYSNFLTELCSCIQEYTDSQIILEDVSRYNDQPEKLYQRLLNMADKCEAIFFNGEYVKLSNANYTELQKHTKLFYYFNAKSPFVTAGIPGVSTDWNHGQYIGIHHLLDCGCRRILIYTGTVRRDGARAALRDSGLDAELLFATGRDDFFEKVQNDTFDGVYCPQDIYAVNAVSILRKRGFTIPGDIAVMGYYNTPWSEHPECPLTSVCINEREMIRRVFGMFTGDVDQLSLMELPGLKIRESTKDFKQKNK